MNLEEREELNGVILDALLDWAGQDAATARYLTDRITASDAWKNRRQGPITDAQVDAAIERFHEPRDETWRDAMRAVLEAARDAS